MTLKYNGRGGSVSAKSISSALIILSLFSLTFGQSFAIAIGLFQIPFAFVISFASLLIMFALGQLECVRWRLGAYLAFACILVASTLAATTRVSISIELIAYAAVLYIPFALRFVHTDQYRLTLNCYQTMMLVLAVVGGAQFTVQLLGFPYISLQELIPGQFLQSGYNYRIPIDFGESVYKSQGVFLLEPSFYSRQLAIAIVIELLTRRRRAYLAVVAIALVTAFSGTGLLMLVVAGSILVMRTTGSTRQHARSRRGVLVAALLLVGGILATPAAGYFANRLSEFTRPTASAYIRFIAPYLALTEHIDQSSISTVALGAGASVAQELKEREIFDDERIGTVHPNAVVKVLIEFGIVGVFLYLVYMLSAVRLRTLDPFFPLHLSTLFMLLFLTGSFVQPQTLYLVVFLSSLSPLNSDQAGTPFASAKGGASAATLS